MKNIKNGLNGRRIWQARVKSTIKPALMLLICASSVSSYAALLSVDQERRIQVRFNDNHSNAYINSTTTSNRQQISSDSMQSLIETKQLEQEQHRYKFDAKVSITESQRVNINPRIPTYNTRYSTTPSYRTGDNRYNAYDNFTSMDFNSWLNSNSWRAQQVASYQRYLSSRLGAQNVPPLEQLLTTARSWNKCGYEPYQLPPQELWSNMVPTLRLYSDLKSQGILPASTKIRSVYRSPNLNACAGGADASKHMTAGAMDIWVPEYNDNLWSISRLQDSLCQFWQYQGNAHNFGLGLYSSGSIHLDTEGYRKWGFQHSSSSSSCRY